MGRAGLGIWLLNVTVDWFFQALFSEHLLWEVTIEAAGEFTEAQKTGTHHVTPSFNYSRYASDTLV